MKGDSAIEAGIKLLPYLISVVIASIASGSLITAFGYYNPVILIEAALLVTGCGLITTFGVNTTLGQWFGYQVLAGLGTGVVFQAGILVVQNTVPPEFIPQATACVQFFQSLGGTIFLAAAQSVFQSGLVSEIEDNAPTVDPKLIVNSGASDVANMLRESGHGADVTAVLDAYASGLRNTFYVSLAGAVCLLLVSLGFSWKKIQKGDGASRSAEIGNEKTEAGVERHSQPAKNV